MQKLLSIAPQFVVPDVVRAAEYYRDKMGFTIRGYWMDPPIYAIVVREGVEIHFGKGDLPTASGNDDRRKGGVDAYIHSQGIDSLFEEFRGRKADILSGDGPEQMEYQQREILVRDCNGFLIAFGESTV